MAASAYRKLHGKQILDFTLRPSKRVKQWEVFSRQWYLYDAKWQNPFESARMICRCLVGANKPIYSKDVLCGDHVVVINTNQISLPDDEWTRRVYFHHTGFPGGASWTRAYELHSKAPTLVLWKAVYRQLGPNNPIRRPAIERLHCFPDDKIPDDFKQNISAQIRQLREVPKSLDYYSEEQVKAYPKVFDWPVDWVFEERDDRPPLVLPTG